MIRHPASLVNKARKLANKGLTYREIGKITGVHDTVVSIWCRDSLKNNPRSLIKGIQEKRNLIKNSEIYSVRKLKSGQDLNKLMCAIIYGCEGSKYPASNCVALTNSEPGLVTSFINLFRKSFNLDESKWRVRLQTHSTHDYEYLITFWSQLLKIPRTKFHKPFVTKPGNKKHRNLYLGTCTVKYYDYRLQLKLIGVFEEFMRKFSSLEDIPSG